MVPKGERFNTVSHLTGALLSVPGIVFLVRPPLLEGDVKKAASLMIYGVTLLLVYVASTLFHAASGETREFYRHCDRIAIYFLIAGTYTPIALLGLPSLWGWPILLTTWAMVAIAVLIELRPEEQKHSGSVELYILMGWMMFPTLLPLLRTLTVPGVVWLLVGGLFYTLGAVLLRWKLVPRFHEIWHVMVLAGSACHYVVMLVYVS